MNKSLTPARTQSRHLVPLVSPQTRPLLALAQRRNWDFIVLGQAPVPEAPVRVGDWQIVPVRQDHSQIPARTLARVQAIYDAGLRPKDFVLVHEAPLQLAPPTKGPAEFQTTTQPDLAPYMKSLGKVAVTVGTAVGLAAMATAAVTAMLAVAVISAIALDPILVAVTEDNYWVEIDRWWA